MISACHFKNSLKPRKGIYRHLCYILSKRRTGKDFGKEVYGMKEYKKAVQSITEETQFVVLRLYKDMQEARSIPTLNNKGYQMSTPSPLLDHWINSYDSCYPLMDIGCAYGINTYRALEKNIPTIAVDLDSRHLEILQSNTDKDKTKFLTLLPGSLPGEIDVPDSSVSGILLSEVLHYLEGEDVPQALQTMFAILRPEGKLSLTALNIYMLANKDERRVAKFFADKVNGEKWPGLTYFDNELISKLRDASKQQNLLHEELGTREPKFVHFFVPDQIVHELKEVGFEILEAKEGSHPGYPNGDDKVANANIQIVAKKPA